MSVPIVLLPCMGGFCERREHCANYHAGSTNYQAPKERICAKGEDGHAPWEIVMPLQTAYVRDSEQGGIE